jgi:hypothetical protein
MPLDGVDTIDDPAHDRRRVAGPGSDFEHTVGD